MNNKFLNIVGLLFLLVALFWIVSVLMSPNSNSNPESSASQEQIDEFAACIAGSGAKFYGAFWCPHCQDQKEMFGNSEELPYVECSQEDGRSQTAVCIKEGIEVYPTWKFNNNKRVTGTLSFEELASETGCANPN